MTWHDWRDHVGKKQEDLHTQWLARGRTGAGRIDLTDVDLSRMVTAGSDLRSARFTRCRLDGVRFNYSRFEGAELVGCTGEDTELATCKLHGARLVGCRLVNGNFILTQFEDSEITSSDFSGSSFGRSSWNGARVGGTSFRGTAIFDSRLDEATFIDCDFNGAYMKETDRHIRLCTTRGTRFERCDLRGSTWQDRVLDDTVFDHCRMYGVQGKPRLAGPVTLIAPDYSEAGDGSDVRADGELPDLWR